MYFSYHSIIFNYTLHRISYVLAARLKKYLSSCSQRTVWKNIAFFQEDFWCQYLAVKRATCHFCSTVHAFKLFIIELCKKNHLTMSCSHREESKVRLVAPVQLVVKNFMIASMTPTHSSSVLRTEVLFCFLAGAREAPVRQADIPVCVLVGLDFMAHSICFMLDRLGMKNHYKAHSIYIYIIFFWVRCSYRPTLVFFQFILVVLTPLIFLPTFLLFISAN